MTSKLLSTTLAGLTLGLALLTGSPDAQAQSIKDYRAGTPVPAPIPVMEHFRWYLRADVGLGLYGTSTASEEGLQFGQQVAGFGAPAPFGTSSGWYGDDFNTFLNAGVGVGMYFTPRLRGDVTIDARTHSSVNGHGTYSYAEQQFTPGPNPTGNTVNGVHTDRSEVRGVTTLFNAYYDLTDRGPGFTPYIGAGIGFVVRTVERESMTSEQTLDPGSNVIGTRSFAGQGKTHQLAPAAALTIGTAYAFQSGVVLDFSYRYTWLGGVEVNSVINNSQSTLKIGDSQDHMLRAGFRVNVW